MEKGTRAVIFALQDYSNPNEGILGLVRTNHTALIGALVTLVDNITFEDFLATDPDERLEVTLLSEERHKWNVATFSMSAGALMPIIVQESI